MNWKWSMCENECVYTFKVSRLGWGNKRMSRFKACSCCFFVGSSVNAHTWCERTVVAVQHNTVSRWSTYCWQQWMHWGTPQSAVDGVAPWWTASEGWQHRAVSTVAMETSRHRRRTPARGTVTGNRTEQLRLQLFFWLNTLLFCYTVSVVEQKMLQPTLTLVAAPGIRSSPSVSNPSSSIQFIS